MREHAVLHTGQDDERELEPLRGVQGHERDRALAVGDLVLVVDERDGIEQHAQRLLPAVGRLRRILDDALGDRAQLPDVLLAAQRLDGALGLELAQVPGALPHLLDELRDAHAVLELGAQRVEQRDERAHRTDRPHTEVGHGVGVARCLHQARAGGQRVRLEGRDAAVTDATARRVDDAPQRDVVVGVRDQLQVAEHVLDLAPLVEAHAPDHAVGHRQAHQRVLEHARLRVGAVEDRDVVERPPAPDVVLDLAHDGERLVLLVGRVVAGQLRTVLRLGPQVLRRAPAVVRDDRVRGGEDRARRAVVARERDHRRVGVVLLEVEDVADGRATERVDALIGVPHDHQVAVPRRKQLDEVVLRAVGVLIFVDHDVGEALAVALEHVGMLAEQVDGAHDQVVEVERVSTSQGQLVGGVDVGDGGVGPAGRALAEHRGGDELVLRAADGVRDGAGRQPLVVESGVLRELRDQPECVLPVVDGEAGLEVERGGLAPQDAHPGLVERGDPGAFRMSGADEHADPVGHLPGGLVGERDRHQPVGRDPVVTDEMRETVGQDAGLARARPGDDEHRAVDGLDGTALGLVEPGEQRRLPHRLLHVVAPRRSARLSGS